MLKPGHKHPPIQIRPRFTVAYQAALDRAGNNMRAMLHGSHSFEIGLLAIASMNDLRLQARNCQIYADELRLTTGPGHDLYIYLN